MQFGLGIDAVGLLLGGLNGSLLGGLWVGVSTTSALPFLGSLLLASASVLDLDDVGVSVGILLRGLGGSLIRCLGGSIDDLGDFLEVTVLVLGTVLGLGPVGVTVLGPGAWTRWSVHCFPHWWPWW